MRVLHVIDTIGVGGCERWLVDIIRLTQSQGVEHRVVTVTGESQGASHVAALRVLGAINPEDTTVTPSADAASAGVDRSPATDAVRTRLRALPAEQKRRLYRLHWWLARFLPLHAGAMRRVLKAYREFRPDIIHAHLSRGLTYALLLRLVSGRPLVFLAPGSFLQLRQSGWAWMVTVYRLARRWIDAVFVDPSYRSDFRSVGMPEAKIHDVKGVIDLEAVEAAAAQRARYRYEVRRELGLADDAVLLLSVGRLDPHKGHQYGIAALPIIRRAFPNTHWIVLGEGYYRQELEALIERSGLGGHAHLLGFRSAPLPYYAAADLFLRTYVSEAENLSSYQALALGLPVVGFDTGSGVELLNKVGHGIQVRNRDAASLAEAGVLILSSADRGRARGARGVAYAREHLDVRTTIAEMLETYRRLVRVVGTDPSATTAPSGK